MKFYKYHALGNDYIVLNPDDFAAGLTNEQICRICNRNYGLGSDGILYGPIETLYADFGVRIFNPDGSEAEKSGNGLRIFSRYLRDMKNFGENPFTISTPGGIVKAQILENGQKVKVEMGQASFDSTEIPLAGPRRQVIDEEMEIDDEKIKFSAVTIGNPHCVILKDEISRELALKLGPKIETHKLFANRTNVQFVKVLDWSNIRIEIWERGAGYTLSSGSSSCAAAAVARKLGLCGPQIKVQMPGGQLDITVRDDNYISMTGPVKKIAEGTISEEIF